MSSSQCYVHGMQVSRTSIASSSSECHGATPETSLIPGSARVSTGSIAGTREVDRLDPLSPALDLPLVASSTNTPSARVTMPHTRLQRDHDAQYARGPIRNRTSSMASKMHATTPKECDGPESLGVLQQEGRGRIERKVAALASLENALVGSRSRHLLFTPV